MNLLKDLLGLIYPELCPGCGNRLIEQERGLCLACRSAMKPLPFSDEKANQVEMLLWGRYPVFRGGACYAFKKDSIVQKTLHSVKYHGNKELALEMGRMMGRAIAGTELSEADFIIPVPLHKNRLKTRGYNQSMLLAQGMAEILAESNPSIAAAELLERSIYNSSQTKTHAGAVGRWFNTEGIFSLPPGNIPLLENRRILLVDDVITTGSTIEACCHALDKAPGVRVAFYCFASTVDVM